MYSCMDVFYSFYLLHYGLNAKDSKIYSRAPINKIPVNLSTNRRKKLVAAECIEIICKTLAASDSYIDQ